MSAGVWFWVRAAARDRRRAAITLALLALLATVVPVVAAAAARRTASSVDRMRDELRPAHLDLQFDEGPPPADVLDTLAAIPGVEVVGEGASILAAPVGSDVELFQAFGQGGVDGRLGHDLERVRLDTGRIPRAADEVLVSRRAAEELDVQVGDTLVLETFTPEAIERIFAGEPGDYDGPRVPLRIVGVGRQTEELTATAGYPIPQFVVPPAFFAEWAGKVHWFDGIYLVRLDGGPAAADDFTTAARRAFPSRPDLGVHVSEEGSRIDGAVSTQATALALLAAVALVTGALATGQAAIRLVRSTEADGRVLAALGLDRRQLATARAGLVVVPVLVGAGLAVAVAIGVSGLFPNGPARRVEPAPGIHPDLPVLVGGAAVVVAATMAATVLLARPRRESPVRRPSRVGDRLGRSIPSVVTAVGVQGALRRTNEPATASTRSAMVALGAGVAGLVGSLVFGASLARLVDDPVRFGWSWDHEVALGDELPDEEALAQARELSEDPSVESVLYARLATKELDGRSTVVFGTEPLSGDLELALVEGRSVQADDEIVVGGSTLDELDKEIGDTVAAATEDGAVQLRIVGQGLFPTNEAEDPAAGAAVTLVTMQRLSGSGGFPNVYLDVAPDADEAALRSDLETTFGPLTGVVPPPVVGNLDLVDQAPYLLAGYLALLGLAASAHAIMMVIRQRRTELATLRCLGFGRRQVIGVVLAHAVTVAVVGVVVGLPLGLAAGGQSWGTVAGGLGFATDPHSPLLVPVATGLGAIVLACLIALGPALWATRQPSGADLRTE